VKKLTGEEMFAMVMRHGYLECTPVDGGPYKVDVDGAMATMTASPSWAQYPGMEMVRGADAVRAMYAQLQGDAFFEVQRWWADEDRQDIILEMRVGKVLPDGRRREWGHVVTFDFEDGLISSEVGYHSIPVDSM
jgi:SnoaL-like domain